jgi:hypothetical protein
MSSITRGSPARAYLRPAGCPPGVDPVKWRRAVERRWATAAPLLGATGRIFGPQRLGQRLGCLLSLPQVAGASSGSIGHGYSHARIRYGSQSSGSRVPTSS